MEDAGEWIEDAVPWAKEPNVTKSLSRMAPIGILGVQLLAQLSQLKGSQMQDLTWVLATSPYPVKW